MNSKSTLVNGQTTNAFCLISMQCSRALNKILCCLAGNVIRPVWTKHCTVLQCMRQRSFHAVCGFGACTQMKCLTISLYK